jgi:hypothetical protein
MSLMLYRFVNIAFRQPTFLFVKELELNVIFFIFCGDSWGLRSAGRDVNAV